MHVVRTVDFYCVLTWIVCCVLQVDGYVTITHDGPVVLGGTITFRADLYEDDGSRPSGVFMYKWEDDALIPHKYKTDSTSNTTSYYSVSYPAENYTVGEYRMEVVVWHTIIAQIWFPLTSRRVNFRVTSLLNGNMMIIQSNETVKNNFVSNASEAKIMINLRKGDFDFITKQATAISIFWFIDCKFYGQTNDFNFAYNFTNSNQSHTIEALVVASYDSYTTTPIVPTTTIDPTSVTPASSVTESDTNTIITLSTLTTFVPATTTSTIGTAETMSMANATVLEFGNVSFPYVCLNSSIIPPDPNKTYGYFHREIIVEAPVSNITVKGTNWIQPWDMLSLNVTCEGSGPFSKCLQFYRGKYNVTGNETCESGIHMDICKFSIVHYFLEPSVYTILVMLKNDIGTQIYPLTINIYKVTTKPQLSVIIVPVSCSLAAVVLIIFGVAYYIQNKARFTIEVANFDFGQNNPEMEYKTFSERLRDSFNSAGYKPLNDAPLLQ